MSQEVSQPQDRFVYTPLSSRPQEIRLLQIDRRHHRFLRFHRSNDVHLTISHIPFNRVGLPNVGISRRSRECLGYKALSYMWGDQPASARIYMNGKVLMVKPNLYAFLRALLEPPARAWFAKDDYLWIDALCINQKDLQERSDQVRLMGRIYASAQQTLIWLKPEEEDPRRPRHIAANAYWKRLWPCQEIILGAQPLIVDGKSTAAIASFFQKSVDQPRENVMQKLALWRRNYRESEASLLEVIKDFGSRECSDIKDKLFALLSLIRRGADFPVNYADSTSTILWKALHHFQGCYRHTGSDDTLEAAISLKLLFNLGKLSRCATLSLDWKCHVNMNRLENNPERIFATFPYIYICICGQCNRLTALVSRIEGSQPHSGEYLLCIPRSLPYPRAQAIFVFMRTPDGGIALEAVGVMKYGLALVALDALPTNDNIIEVTDVHARPTPEHSDAGRKVLSFDRLRRTGSCTVTMTSSLLYGLMEAITVGLPTGQPRGEDEEVDQMLKELSELHASAQSSDRCSPPMWRRYDGRHEKSLNELWKLQ